MEDVAEHINEMQRIHDEYGHVFDELSRSRHTNAAVGTRLTHVTCRRDAEIARPENDGQRKTWDWNLTDWKMMDKL